ncbi:MAG TPA: MinD/ParA family protein [Frankiaceae bacterium]|nr:MinD/ParA family protein [Frankiaceae bacterium]
MRAHEPKAGDDNGAATNNSGTLATSLAKLGLLGDGLGAPGGSLLPTSRVTITSRPDGTPAAPPARRSSTTAGPDPDGTGKASTGGAAAGAEVRGEPGVGDEPEEPTGPEVGDEPDRQPDEEPGGAAVAAADTGPLRLDPAALLPARVEVADGGWRRAVYRMTRGRVNPGPSEPEKQRRELVRRVRTPLVGCHRLAVLSLKGGVGKTTTTVAIGAVLASLRGDRVIALDANPDRGTLGGKLPRGTSLCIRDLLDHRDEVQRYADVRRYISQADSRLEVLASDEDPEVSLAFSEEDYRAVDDILQRYYSILLTDCGTGMLHSAMQGVLALADTLVIVSTASVDGAASASATMDWLDAHGHRDLVRRAVTVISNIPAGGAPVDVDQLARHFATRTRRVVRVPYDPHLAAGGHVDLDALGPTTRAAYLHLAAAVADGFGRRSP